MWPVYALQARLRCQFAAASVARLTARIAGLSGQPNCSLVRITGIFRGPPLWVPVGAPSTTPFPPTMRIGQRSFGTETDSHKPSTAASFEPEEVGSFVQCRDIGFGCADQGVCRDCLENQVWCLPQLSPSGFRVYVHRACTPALFRHLLDVCRRRVFAGFLGV